MIMYIRYVFIYLSQTGCCGARHRVRASGFQRQQQHTWGLGGQGARGGHVQSK